MRLARWFIGIVGGVLVTLWVIVGLGTRTPVLQSALVKALDDQLDADVELQSFDVATFPRIRIHGDGLRVRLKGQTEEAPLIEVAHFEVSGGMLGMLRRPRRFSSVTLDGLRITIPPRSGHDRESGNKAANETASGPIIIDHIESHDAQLVIVPRNPRKAPKIWNIKALSMESVGFARSMPFSATLTNPVPQGLIDVAGSFGPWRARVPGDTPLSGRYTLKNADLGTIDGIGGVLSSTGGFSGILSSIDVQGTTSTPDFRVDVGGQPVPLDTTFHVVVDGTDGDTYLKRVDAKWRSTSLTASGAVVGTPGVKGRTVALDVRMPHGRVEDVLALAVRATKPVMTGDIALDTSLELPPGKRKIADRLQLDGRFTLAQTRFTDANVHRQVVSLSRHGQGRKNDEPIGGVVSDLRGTFRLREGTIRFDPVTFAVPGAHVRLTGNYGLRSEQLDFTGTLAMDAPLSKVAGGGVKGFFLKAVDPIFRKRGAGTLLPIHISGRRDDPKFGLQWGKMFSPD